MASIVTMQITHIVISQGSHGYVAGDARGAVRSVRRAVMSDAAMLDAVLELDVWDKERVEGGRRPSGLLYLWNQRYNSVCTE